MHVLLLYCNSSTPYRHLPNLQRVEAELETLATTQKQGSRDIQEMKDDIRAIKEDLSTLLANSRRQSSSSRVRIPPRLSMSCLYYVHIHV